MSLRFRTPEIMTSRASTLRRMHGTNETARRSTSSNLITLLKILAVLILTASIVLLDAIFKNDFMEPKSFPTILVPNPPEKLFSPSPLYPPKEDKAPSKTINSFVCISGQLQRLELDNKLVNLLEPMKKTLGGSVYVALVMTENKAIYTKDQISEQRAQHEPQFETYQEAVDYLAKRGFIVLTESPYPHSPNPYVYEEYLQRLAQLANGEKLKDPKFFDYDKRRAQNHVRQAIAGELCYRAMESSAIDFSNGIIARFRDDVGFQEKLPIQNMTEWLHDPPKIPPGKDLAVVPKLASTNRPTIITPYCRNWFGMNDRGAFVHPNGAYSYFMAPLLAFNSSLQLPSTRVCNHERFLRHVYNQEGFIFVPKRELYPIPMFRNNGKGVFRKEEVDHQLCRVWWNSYSRDCENANRTVALLSSSSDHDIKMAKEEPLVHVIHTRFMQHQPNLLLLGKARLELFTTFCVKTIAEQTSSNFVWMIRVDPKLSSTLLQPLLDSLASYNSLKNRVAVIGSNEVRKGSRDGGFRNDKSMEDVTLESLLYGMDLETLQRYHKKAKTSIVLETNLDADDGLAITFVQRTQALAKQLFSSRNSNSAWVQICVGKHLEWQFFAPWKKKGTNQGSLLWGSTHICVTPGLTWATQPQAQPNFIKAHHVIKKGTPQCNDTNILNPSSDLGCWHELPPLSNTTGEDFMAIRARTPTSTGMNRVVLPQDKYNSKQIAKDEKAWPELEPIFAISKLSVQKARHYLNDHLQELVCENLEGQCQEDHSCSVGIKDRLKGLMLDGKCKNKHDIVHIVYTSVSIPDSSPSLSLQARSLALLDTWKWICLHSLKNQISNEFLWIVTMEEKDVKYWMGDKELKQKLLNLIKEIKKSALNTLLLVKSEPQAAFWLDIRDSSNHNRLFTNQSLLYGNVSTIGEFSEAAQNRTVLETSLGPTEGLIETFISDLQSAMVQLGRQDYKSSDAWHYECIPAYMEWNYFGSDKIVGTLDPEPRYVRMKSLDVADGNCMQHPGTTRVSLPGTKLSTAAVTNVSKTKICDLSISKTYEPGCFDARVPASETTAGGTAIRVLLPESLQPPSLREDEASKLHGVSSEQLKRQDIQLRETLQKAYLMTPSYLGHFRREIKKDMESTTANN